MFVYVWVAYIIDPLEKGLLTPMLGVFNLGPFLEWSLKPHFETFVYNFFLMTPLGYWESTWCKILGQMSFLDFFKVISPQRCKISAFSLYIYYIFPLYLNSEMLELTYWLIFHTSTSIYASKQWFGLDIPTWIECRLSGIILRPYQTKKAERMKKKMARSAQNG